MERYLDSWSYAVRGTDIENLMFDISVYRAPITNTQDKTLVAQRRFMPWGQKVLSPGELIQMFNRVHSVNQCTSTAEDQLKRLLEPFRGKNPEEQLKAYLDKNASEENEKMKRLIAGATEAINNVSAIAANASAHHGGGGAEHGEADTGSAFNIELSVHQQELQHLLQRQNETSKKPPKNFHIFTRPPSESFMNPLDRVCEVIPAQPMTNLCAIINRLTPEQRMQVDALQEHNFSGASSSMHEYGPPQPGSTSSTLLLQNPLETMQAGITGAAVPFLAKHVPTAQSESSMFFLLATGTSVQQQQQQPQQGGGGAVTASSFQWLGREEVLIQLTKMPDGALVTRPSLAEEHVLHVDDAFVISAIINLSTTTVVSNDDKILAVLDAAAKLQLARRSVLVDPEEEEVVLSARRSRGEDGGGPNQQPQSEREEASEQRWRQVRANVVQRGVVLEMAKRAQSPAAPDASGSVRSVRMLRQALGIHDLSASSWIRSGSATSGTNATPFKSGAEVFAPKRPRDILNILEDGGLPASNHQAGGGGGGGGGENNKRSSNQPQFTPMPPPGTKRVHWFVTLDSILNIERESLFARCTWILPSAGVVLDSDTDRACDVREVMQFTTQTAFAARYLSETFMPTTKHMLNCPLELHCLMNDVTPGTPRLVVEVYSGGDGNGHQTLEGYAVVTCSPTPGTWRQRVDMWRPQMSGWETLKSMFVGGSTSLVDREAVALPYEQLAADALNLDATVRRELAEQQQQQQQQQAEQQQRASGMAGVVDVHGNNLLLQQQHQQQQHQTQLLKPRNVAPLRNLPEEVQQDIALASSVACVNRSGLLATSEGHLDLKIMCIVQQQ